ncbi:small G protein signaling modulator 1-like isoform X1 [Salvia divinorum]|uniref:Small G protein signaling modulator 1-like isoform X1 n=1 Tax=Salvia divinorum TaxID=28513 RepID=A0ABD1GP89_SALDI
MSFYGGEKQWKCAAPVVSAVGKMLKPDKWESTFDCNGKILDFRKVLKLIILDVNCSFTEISKATFGWTEFSGPSQNVIFSLLKSLFVCLSPGVDPSIRAEVWEFLLCCYSLSSTAEYRKQLRAARRERYRDLVMECHVMHSSIGTGSLAYVVLDGHSTDNSYKCLKESSNDYGDLVCDTNWRVYKRGEGKVAWPESTKE